MQGTRRDIIRRTRQWRVILVGGAAAVSLAVAAGLGVAAGRHDDGSSPAPTSNTGSATPQGTAGNGGQQADVVGWLQPARVERVRAPPREEQRLVMIAPAIARSDWELWSTDARVCVTDPSALDEARGIADRILEEVELAASRFRQDSEVSRLPSGTSRISPTLAALLSVALDAATPLRWCGRSDARRSDACHRLRPRHHARCGARTRERVAWSRVAGWESLRLEGDQPVPARGRRDRSRCHRQGSGR